MCYFRLKFYLKCNNNRRIEWKLDGVALLVEDIARQKFIVCFSPFQMSVTVEPITGFENRFGFTIFMTIATICPRLRFRQSNTA